ncbi:hypothetical protein F2Q68_00043318 [Brassica cretica]|uniref:Uncharacterized protein n=2 Tax=Brassica cretica TaxID=69181 RepID=A0A3N6R1P6_BRACR|nr:hypothetical protein F2Q68_00043318 [Brassica cretica]KAF3517532.1 hypothetical protein DY000_02058826 [Brassica cretica]
MCSSETISLVPSFDGTDSVVGITRMPSSLIQMWFLDLFTGRLCCLALEKNIMEVVYDWAKGSKFYEIMEIDVFLKGAWLDQNNKENGGSSAKSS